jgi:hypothetical protein
MHLNIREGAMEGTPARVVETASECTVLMRNSYGGNTSEHLGAGGKLRMFLTETRLEGLNWICLTHDRGQRLAFVDNVINFRIP